MREDTHLRVVEDRGCAWRKLHLAVDANTGEIAACLLTDNRTDDAGQAPALLDATAGELASVTTDGAYDGAPVYTRQLLGDSPTLYRTSSSRRARRL